MLLLEGIIGIWLQLWELDGDDVANIALKLTPPFRTQRSASKRQASV